MNKDKILIEEFITNHSAEAANLLEQMNADTVSHFISKLESDLSVILLRELDVFLAASCLEKIDLEKSVKIIEKLPTLSETSILRRMKSEIRNKIIQNLDTQLSISLSQMLQYEDNTVGSLLNPQVHIIESNLTVKEAIDKVKKNKSMLSSYIYVIDSRFKFLGIIALKDLITADPKEQITNIIDYDVPYLFADLGIAKIKEHSGWLDYDALPVTDRQGILLGAVEQTAVRKINIDKQHLVPKEAMQASTALGELFKIGLSGLLYSTSDKAKSKE